MRLPVHTAVWAVRVFGAPAASMGDQVLDAGSYRPPVPAATRPSPSSPPHTIMTPPASTTLWPKREAGAPDSVVVAQLSSTGSYSAPVLSRVPAALLPPQMIMRPPSQRAECPVRATKGGGGLLVGA